MQDSSSTIAPGSSNNEGGKSPSAANIKPIAGSSANMKKKKSAHNTTSPNRPDIPSLPKGDDLDMPPAEGTLTPKASNQNLKFRSPSLRSPSLRSGSLTPRQACITPPLGDADRALVSIKGSIKEAYTVLTREMGDVIRAVKECTDTMRSTRCFNAKDETFQEWGHRLDGLCTRIQDILYSHKLQQSDALDPTLRPHEKDKAVPVPGKTSLRFMTAISKTKTADAPGRLSVSQQQSRSSGNLAAERKASMLPEVRVPKPPVTSHFKHVNSSTFIAINGDGGAKLSNQAVSLANALQVLLDSASRTTKSEKAILYVPFRGDVHDLSAISAVGYGPDTKIQDLRLRDNHSAPSLALQTGIIIAVCRGHNPPREVAKKTMTDLQEQLNQQTSADYTTDVKTGVSTKTAPLSAAATPAKAGTTPGSPHKSADAGIRATTLVSRSKYWSSLSIPIRRRGQTKGCAVLQVINKNFGNSNYDSDDEHFLHGMALLIGSIFERCDDYDMLAKLYEPKLAMPPVQDLSAIGNVAPRGSKEQLVYHTWDTAHGKDVRMLLADDSVATKLDDSTPLMRVAQYITSLQEMWKQSVLTNMDYQRAHEERTQFVKKLVERVRRAEFKTESLKRAQYDSTVVKEDERPVHLMSPEPSQTSPENAALYYIADRAQSSVETEEVGVNTDENWEAASRPRGKRRGTTDLDSLWSDDDHYSEDAESSRRPKLLRGDNNSSPAILFDTVSNGEDCDTPSARGASASMHSLLNAGRSGLKPQSISLMDKDQRKKFAEEQEEGKIKYKIGNVIGVGAHGTVHSALIEATGESAAVKKVVFADTAAEAELDEKLRSLQVEVNLLKALEHPNIVRYLFVDKVDGPPRGVAIFMEHVSGGSITQVVKEFGSLPERTAAIFTAQLLVGLVYLHEKGVAHRDIKPANCLVSALGDVKLGDFGTATLFEPKEANAATGLEGVPQGHAGACGTPYYMAPEVIRQDPDRCHWQCDIWSLGCTVMEMLTGVTPFDHIGDTAAVVLRYVGQRTPGDPVEIPTNNLSAEAQDFLSHCCSSDPKLRPAAAALLHHPWFSKFDIVERDDTVAESEACDASMHAFFTPKTLQSTEEKEDGTGSKGENAVLKLPSDEQANPLDPGNGGSQEVGESTPTQENRRGSTSAETETSSSLFQMHATASPATSVTTFGGNASLTTYEGNSSTTGTTIRKMKLKKQVKDEVKMSMSGRSRSGSFTEGRADLFEDGAEKGPTSILEPPTSGPTPPLAAVDDTKKDEAAVDDTKKDEAAVDDTKKDEATVDDTKMDEAAVDDTKKDEAAVDDTKKDEADM